MANTSVEIDKNLVLNSIQNDVVSSPPNKIATEVTSTDAYEQTSQYRETVISPEYSTSSATNDEFDNSSNSMGNLNNNSKNISNSTFNDEMNDATEINSTSENLTVGNTVDSNNKCNNKNNAKNNNTKNHKNYCKRFNRSNSNYSSNSCQKHTNQSNRIKKRTRRGKSKRSNKPYKKSGFKFLRPKSCPNAMGDNRRLNLFTNQPLVPYNTNKFLMEFHAVEMQMTPGRTRNSSLSVESDDNYFFSLPEDEEDYLTKEFSSVYENARCETLNNMDKNQLIQQYLHLEAKLEQANRRVDAKDDRLKTLEDTVKSLTAENSELRRKLDIKSGCQYMDSDSDSTSSSSSSCSSSSTCSSLSQHHDMMDSDDDIQIQPITNGVLEDHYQEVNSVEHQNGNVNEEDIYRSPALSPAFAPISSC